MRLRTALPAVMGALLLTLAMPTSANAAIGTFTYRVPGVALPRIILDPPNNECIDIPEADDPSEEAPVNTPRNLTNRQAVVYADPGCEGDFFHLRPGGSGTNALKFRSVVFIAPQ
ncbi:hypothetical protein ACQKM2_38230 [Streptomyces sp. NPDC004126]|uniref:hypothetical protein n=1 Tax=Streptomyces sp. NPDC004126 TaxID=3390695 RepID=UPI003D037802